MASTEWKPPVDFLGVKDSDRALPSGTRQARWVEIDNQVCVRSLVTGEGDQVCAPFNPETKIDLGTLAWGPSALRADAGTGVNTVR